MEKRIIYRRQTIKLKTDTSDSTTYRLHFCRTLSDARQIIYDPQKFNYFTGYIKKSYHASARGIQHWTFNSHLYYELVTVTLIRNVNSIKIDIIVPFELLIDTFLYIN